MPKSLQDFIQDPEPQKDNKDASGKKKKEPKPKSVLEGTLEVMPDCSYKAGEAYELDGLGAIFDGTYKVKKAIHTISASGYTTSLEMTRRLGGGAGKKDGGDEAPRKEPASTPAVAKEEEGMIFVDKQTGRVTGG